VEALHAQGVSKTKALVALGICCSTYYSWFKERNSGKRGPSLVALTEQEREAIIAKKEQEPYLSHRQISGFLRHEQYWISPSSCYRVLKLQGLILSQELRPSPWKKPHYEPFRPNQIWGIDWTILLILERRYYLLSLIDYFSRYIVAWGMGAVCHPG